MLIGVRKDASFAVVIFGNLKKNAKRSLHLALVWLR